MPGRWRKSRHCSPRSEAATSTRPWSISCSTSSTRSSPFVNACRINKLIPSREPPFRVRHIGLSTGAAIAEDPGVLLHVDAAQSAGKFHIDLSQIPIDLLSLSAHKFHGPKGVRCLFIRDRPRLRTRPLTFGGGQELGLLRARRLTLQTGR
ncbi:MAG: aminotransferase class V-fold PLP-dependent enzyme [Gammaproteobacteria bacterium]|nr:aminotransferase class V-fold PLP-dependent enzyme [Gammaproteobacteria bacterium]